MGFIYKWQIEKIIFLPFGALTIFNEDLNRPIKEEFMIVIMGPIFQIILTLFLYLNNNLEGVKYSLIILMFNLLPIYPLDGSKVCNLFLNKITSFKQSHVLIIIISLLTIILLTIKVKFNLIFILIIIFLLIKIIREIKDHNSLFNRFLLERYLKKYHFKKVKKINSLDLTKMKRDFRHLFYDGNVFISERKNLQKRFDFKHKPW